MTGLALRDYVPSDLADVVRIENECFPPAIAYSREVLKSEFESSGSVSLIAELNGSIVGLILANYQTKRPDGYISSVDVSKSHRREGIARQLVTAVESDFMARGNRQVVLEVGIENHEATQLYYKLGYKTHGTKKAFYADGTDALELAKEL
jgi:ribosomal-protein-alanine N-acetyltransferase